MLLQRNTNLGTETTQAESLQGQSLTSAGTVPDLCGDSPRLVQARASALALTQGKYQFPPCVHNGEVISHCRDPMRHQTVPKHFSPPRTRRRCAQRKTCASSRRHHLDNPASVSFGLTSVRQASHQMSSKILSVSLLQVSEPLSKSGAHYFSRLFFK